MFHFQNRTLTGTVIINGSKDTSPAIMLIGENGFGISYVHDNDLWSIKPDGKLDLGYQAPILSTDEKTYTKALSLLKDNKYVSALSKEGINAEELSKKNNAI